jgi:hypothetical protein
MTFWADTSYDIYTELNPWRLSIKSTDQFADLDSVSLIFRQWIAGPQVDERVKLSYDTLKFVNGGSWTSFNAYVRGSGGQLDLYNGGNGNYLARLGSTSLNSQRGSLQLYNTNGNIRMQCGVSSNNFGFGYCYGPNGNTNIYMAEYADLTDQGAIYVGDPSGTQKAGIYVNALNQGVLWGDLKPFRMDHPEKKDKEIWYVSLEGPEAGAYERGTTALVNGEVFVSFSDHYQIVANPGTMTVNLTPLEWDTYGLAVIKKTKEGFWVKELKGGTGNFSFDWEVKCKRKGYEQFSIIRDKNDLMVSQIEPIPEADSLPDKRVSKKMYYKTITTSNQCSAQKAQE